TRRCHRRPRWARPARSSRFSLLGAVIVRARWFPLDLVQIVVDRETRDLQGRCNRLYRVAEREDATIAEPTHDLRLLLLLRDFHWYAYLGDGVLDQFGSEVTEV